MTRAYFLSFSLALSSLGGSRRSFSFAFWARD